MRKLLVALALAVPLFLPQPTPAWNGRGHMTVAYIAYRNLSPAARTEINRLLRQHPDYNRWVRGLPRNSNQRGLVAFVKAATWPDDIKSDSRFFDENKPPTPIPPTLEGFPNMLRNRSWHFIDIPFSPDSTPLEQPPPVNAKAQISEFSDTIGNDGASAQDRVYDLPWLIHLVGDIHQPLHCAGRFTRAHRHGDGGGNAFKLSGRVDNLHSFWDGLLGNKTDRASVATLGRSIMREFPREDSDSTNVEEWVDDSAKIAREFVYTVGVENARNPPRPSAAYRREATDIARRRVALGGYHLANLINRALSTP